MNAKQFLQQARFIDQRIESRIEERDRLLQMVSVARSPQLTGMPAGGGHSWTDSVDKAVDLCRVIDADISRLIALKRELWDVIDSVEDMRYRTVLDLRYRAGRTWEQIAEGMHYDVRTIYRLHGRALLAVNTKMLS